jgi:hypothetical protein
LPATHGSTCESATGQHQKNILELLYLLQSLVDGHSGDH